MKPTLLLLAIFAGSCCLAQTGTDSLHKKLFTAGELRQDLDSLHATIKSNHPDLWRYADSAWSERQWTIARNSINKPMKRWEFLRVLSPLLAQYKDGHTYISYFDFDIAEVTEMMERNTKIFPFDVDIREGKIRIKEDWGNNSGIKKGSLIKTINGVPVKNILQALMPLMSGDYMDNTESTLSKFLSFFLWAHYGWENNFTITLTGKDGKAGTFVCGGIEMKDYINARFPKNDWSMQLYEPESLAVIECRNYRNEKAARHFIDSVFVIIKEKNIQQLAFDIRRNGGGNSAIGDYLLAYVTDKAYSSAASKTIRDASLVRQFKEGSWVNDMLLRYKKEGSRVGDRYTLPFEIQKPDTVSFPQNRFKGKFYLLTGPATYSSAHMTAIAVKCFKLGTVIGSATGERMDLTGEVMGYSLPHTKLNAYCATAMYKAPCGEPGQMGVQPDVRIPFNENDLEEGRDSVIGYLKAFVKGK